MGSTGPGWRLGEPRSGELAARSASNPSQEARHHRCAGQGGERLKRPRARRPTGQASARWHGPRARGG
eukprot:4926332-Pyramimonas_sp.AAC.1